MPCRRHKTCTNPGLRQRRVYLPPTLILSGLRNDLLVLGIRILDPSDEANRAKNMQPEKVSCLELAMLILHLIWRTDRRQF